MVPGSVAKHIPAVYRYAEKFSPLAFHCLFGFKFVFPRLRE